MTSFTINGNPVTADVDDDTPLLWVVRDTLRLTGSKFGCGIGQCGACTMLVDGRARRSCLMQVKDLAGLSVVTIEGLQGREAAAVTAAWEGLDVPQCGWCQSGQIISAVALLRKNARPSDVDIDRAMSGNICRCATYLRIRRAIHDAAAALEG